MPNGDKTPPFATPDSATGPDAASTSGAGAADADHINPNAPEALTPDSTVPTDPTFNPPDAAVTSTGDSDEDGGVAVAEAAPTYDRTTDDIASTRVVHPDEPDLNTASDHTATAQGNRYPPGLDYYRSVARNARAEAEAARVQAEQAETAAVEAERAVAEFEANEDKG